MTDTRRLYVTRSPEETGELAQAFGAILQPGDQILLEGPVGAGKTHFARCLIQSMLGWAEDVPSPTFTLVQTYDTEKAEIWHADLYRLTSPDEVIELGLDETFETAICLIEWPDRLGSLVPADALRLQFVTVDDETREITATGPDTAWRDRLPETQNA
ncbi:tRNA (adenosine(37)-N6)-threonylcarbamoyltransferase complex ATPase subunit type 1 TsaE [Pseudooceanicola atlanticus]|uniref:tRNA threonylcarbamoyladenosine biosynthesis protein TsaE n=1 Tax=Pseudooceanicola atlanticus TaxID=1461694 RepID=A0A0A0E9H6_9RHOB|nr:tRNA (adenosine(37)-N6)-threonylcarbamoyltransferase complex ATPase subunit type 1 TsaE [Pseudooceanicola atlanticus]KGM47114.1 hydrolase [Pseudooceanicola atlanticus]